MDMQQQTFYLWRYRPWKSFELLETLLKAEKSESTEIPRGLTTKIQKFAKKDLGNITHKPEAI